MHVSATSECLNLLVLAPLHLVSDLGDDKVKCSAALDRLDQCVQTSRVLGDEVE